jgi:hypothetical protein
MTASKRPAHAGARARLLVAPAATTKTGLTVKALLIARLQGWRT